MYNILFINLLIANFLLVMSIVNVYSSWNNFLLALLSMELSMVTMMSLYLMFSYIMDDMVNQVLAILMLTVAAAETVVGLLLLMNFMNLKHTVQVDKIY